MGKGLDNKLAKLLDKVGIRERAEPLLVEEALCDMDNIAKCADTHEALVAEMIDVGLTEDDAKAMADAVFAETKLKELVTEIEKIAPVLSEEMLSSASKRVKVLAAGADLEGDDKEMAELLTRMSQELGVDEIRQLLKIKKILFYKPK